MSRSRLLSLLAVAVVFPLACRTPTKVTSPPSFPPPSASPPEQAALWSQAQQVFESRCVVCHGCYDAPCQLKLGTYEGIERGASGDRVYDATRLVAASPTRLGIDAHDAGEWRKKGFHPVLPEGASSDPRASLLVRMLDLKRARPLPASVDFSREFTLDLDRKETCAAADTFDDYAKSHPFWGMPYAMPGLDASQERALVEWVASGAPHPAVAALAAPLVASIDAWEAFLDDPSMKGQLVGRY